MLPVEFDGSGKIDIREDIAVQHQKRIGTPESVGILNPSPGSQQHRFPADLEVVESVPLIGLSQKGFDLFWKVMGIQYKALDLKTGQGIKNPGQQRAVEQREEGLGS
jgi:hypothetical protein